MFLLVNFLLVLFLFISIICLMLFFSVQCTLNVSQFCSSVFIWPDYSSKQNGWQWNCCCPNNRYEHHTYTHTNTRNEFCEYIYTNELSRIDDDFNILCEICVFCLTKIDSHSNQRLHKEHIHFQAYVIYLFSVW